MNADAERAKTTEPRAAGFLWAGLLGPFVAVVLAVLAAFVIHRISGEVHLDAIRAAAAATPPAAIATAAFLTMVSFATMALYDVIAVRRVVPGRVPTWLAAFAGVTGFAISNTLGFHLFVGGPVRYRIYATVGLDAADVGRVVGLAFASTWLGIAAILAPRSSWTRSAFPFCDGLRLPRTGRLGSPS